MQTVESKKNDNQPAKNVLLQHSYTAMLLTDYHGKILWANNASEQLFTTSAKRLRKYNIHQLLQSVENNTKTPTKPTNTPQTDIQPLISHDQWILGTHRPLFVDYSISLFEANSPQQSMQDLGYATNQAFEALSNNFARYLIEIWSKDRHNGITQEHHQHSQHMIAKKMLRSVAHEVKNPLAGIRGAGQLLEKHIKKLEIDDPKVNTYCHIIINEADRLNNLITELLGSHRLPDCQPINIHQVLEHVLTLAHSQHPELKIVRDYDLSLPEIEADKDQMIQIFLNLVNNAIEAMFTQTLKTTESRSTNQKNDQKNKQMLTIKTRVEFQFTIGAVKHKKIAKICIHDNGSGISEDIIDKIFFPLVTGRASGTGLGLSVVHDIVQYHQGHIDVKSQVGDTRFMVYLPFNQSE